MSLLTEAAPVSARITIDTLRADSHALTQSRSKHFNWLLGIWLAVFHLGAIAALFFFSWSALAATVVLWVLGQNVGIAMCYHRLLTHRGYATPRWVEYTMAVFATLAYKEGRSSGWPCTGCIISLRIARAIPIPRAMVNGGRIQGGCCKECCATATLP